MNKKNQIFRNIALISQLGINIVVPIFLCLLVGKGIDMLLGTSFFIIIMLVIGVLSGGKSAYDTAMNSVRMDEAPKENYQEMVDKYNKEHDSSEQRSGT